MTQNSTNNNLSDLELEKIDNSELELGKIYFSNLNSE